MRIATQLHHTIPASLFDFPKRRKRDTRPSAARRGYGPTWKKIRLLFLAQHPACLYCRRKGKHSTSTSIDHVPPHKGDMVMFWNTTTWTPTCDACHRHVSAKYDGGLGRPVKPREGAYVAPRPGELDEGQA